jgi:hypothetical protein
VDNEGEAECFRFFSSKVVVDEVLFFVEDDADADLDLDFVVDGLVVVGSEYPEGKHRTLRSVRCFGARDTISGCSCIDSGRFSISSNIVICLENGFPFEKKKYQIFDQKSLFKEKNEIHFFK